MGDRTDRARDAIWNLFGWAVKELAYTMGGKPTGATIRRTTELERKPGITVVEAVEIDRIVTRIWCDYCGATNDLLLIRSRVGSDILCRTELPLCCDTVRERVNENSQGAN